MKILQDKGKKKMEKNITKKYNVNYITGGKQKLTKCNKCNKFKKK